MPNATQTRAMTNPDHRICPSPKYRSSTETAFNAAAMKNNTHAALTILACFINSFFSIRLPPLQRVSVLDAFNRFKTVPG
jgi:hypothetical protein